MKIKWHDTDTETAKLVEGQVIEDLITLDVDHPSDLIFHYVFLDPTRDMCGPSVFVWGERGSDEFHCQYQETTEWTTMSDDED